MEYSDIKDLIKTIDSSNITEFELQFKDTLIKINKTSVVTSNNASAVHVEQSYTKINIPESATVIEGKKIISPLVGTFYQSSTPNGTPIVSVGTTVNKGDVLCIIEAMKIMNEVTSPYSGVVKEILVEDSQMVEYNQVLFIIE